MTPTSLGLNPERLPDCVYGIGETVERDRGKSKSWKRRNPSCRLGWIKCLSGARWISSRFLPLPCTFTRALDSLFHSAAIRPRDPPLPIRDSSARARIPFWSDTPCSSSLTEIRERERTSNADCAHVDHCTLSRFSCWSSHRPAAANVEIRQIDFSFFFLLRPLLAHGTD